MRRFLFAYAVVMAACLVNPTPGGGQTGGVIGAGPGGGGPDSGAPADGGTNGAAACDAGCAEAAACGAFLPSTCVADCASNATLAGCLAAAQSCNDNALCWWAQQAQQLCDAGTGVPSGAASCQFTQQCEANCVTTQSLSCVCDCLQGLSPSKASLLFDSQTCNAAQCSGCAYPTLQCQTCIGANCNAQYTACAQN